MADWMYLTHAPDQLVTGDTAADAADAAGTILSQNLEGNSSTTFPVWIVPLETEAEQFDIVATATIERDVTVTEHTP